MTLSAALFSSNDQTHCTPQIVIDHILGFEERGIALDPCSNERSLVGAKDEWRIERGEDGLAREWPATGLVFVNNPYDEMEAWTKKIVRESARGVEIITCLPARTSEKWFHTLIPSAAAICFWKGRLKFGKAIASTRQANLFVSDAIEPPAHEQTDGAPFPSFLSYHGGRARRFCRAFEGAGWCTVTR